MNAGQIIEDEVNSVDDNPIVDMDSQNVIHGGNFHGDYISFEMDKLKIAVTKMTILAERQMNYLSTTESMEYFRRLSIWVCSD